MSKELNEELNEQVLTYDEWAREKCIEKLAACRIEQLEAERVLDEQRVADLMAQVADIAAERDRQLAEAQARIYELTTMCEDLVCEAKDFAYKLEQKTVQLVEAHAALALKDEAFQKIIDIRIIPATTYGIARTALAIKPDNGALREWGARLLEEADQAFDAIDGGGIGNTDLAAALRLGEWPVRRLEELRAALAKGEK